MATGGEASARTSGTEGSVSSKFSLPVITNSPTFIDFIKSPTWMYPTSRFFGDALYGIVTGTRVNHAYMHYVTGSFRVQLRYQFYWMCWRNGYPETKRSTLSELLWFSKLLHVYSVSCMHAMQLHTYKANQLCAIFYFSIYYYQFSQLQKTSLARGAAV